MCDNPLVISRRRSKVYIAFLFDLCLCACGLAESLAYYAGWHNTFKCDESRCSPSELYICCGYSMTVYLAVAICVFYTHSSCCLGIFLYKLKKLRRQVIKTQITAGVTIVTKYRHGMGIRITSTTTLSVDYQCSWESITLFCCNNSTVPLKLTSFCLSVFVSQVTAHQGYVSHTCCQVTPPTCHLRHRTLTLCCTASWQSSLTCPYWSR